MIGDGARAIGAAEDLLAVPSGALDNDVAHPPSAATKIAANVMRESRDIDDGTRRFMSTTREAR